MPKKPPSGYWVPLFLEYLSVDRGVSPHTLTSYSRTLELFREQAGKNWAAVTTDDIHAYGAKLLKDGSSAKTVRQRIAALRHFFRFLFFEKFLPYELTRHVQPPKAPKAVVRPVTTEEMDKMLAAIGTATALDLRNRALLHVAFGSGLRVSEILNLRTKDVDLERGIAKVRKGKGGKDRLTPMNPPEMQAIRDYLERARPHLAKERTADYLFISDDAQPLTRQRIWQIFEGRSLTVLGRTVSPHKHRHAFVTETMKGGADIRVVQTMVGHRHVKTTEHYLHSDFDRVREWYFKTHPRGVMPLRKPINPFPVTIERVLAIKESENASPNTVRAYRADLIDLANYIGPTQPAEALSRETVRSFLAWIATRSLNKGTIKRRLYAIKSFARWMRREELISEDACETIVGVHGPKIPENLPDIPSPDAMKRLLDGPFPTAFPARDRLMLELLYGAGLRVSEAAHLTLDSFIPEQRAILVRGKGGMYGKDSKERLVPINPYMQKAIDEYLPARAKILTQQKIQTRALFFRVKNGFGDCITSRSLARILLKVTELRGMQPLNPHRLRHAAATHMLDNKCPLDVLKDLLGHDNINVTAMYCQVSTRLMMDSYQGAHPYAVAGQKDGAA